jgi:flagella basal body P-ring formation protein FlgA
MNHVANRLCLAAIAVLMFCSSANAVTEITLREKVAANSSVVRLGDVATIESQSASEQRRLGAILLLPAPAPGTQRFVRLREIQDMLAAQGENIGQMRFGGADQVAIQSPAAVHSTKVQAPAGGKPNRQAALLVGQMQVSSPEAPVAGPKLTEADAERLRGELNELIKEYLSLKAGQAEAWRVTCIVPDRFLETLMTARTEPKCSEGREPWTGRQRFVVSFTTAKGNVQFPVLADVALATQAIVAVRPIERGGVITAAHVQLMTVDYAPARSDERVPLDSLDKVIGMEAREAIRAGEMVLSNQVRAPLLVKRGEELAVTARNGRIRVQTFARSLQDGARGDLVQVETLDKKDRYDVRVTGTREALVFSPTRPASTQSRLPRAETAKR